jgi:sulfur carrier protein
MIEVTVNGTRHALESRLTVADLIARLGFAGKRVAVERNGEIVPRSQLAAQALDQGDRVEIVVAVGGG